MARQLPAIDTLRRIWIQQFYLADGSVHWRETEGIPPSSLFISSPYDLDAHYARKGTTSWVGYKVHLTETCDADRPRIITHVQTCAAPLADGAATTPAHKALEDKGLLPAQHLVDTGCIDAGLLVETRRRFAVDLIGPVRRDRHWQARTGTGFSAEAFQVRLGATARDLSPRRRERKLDAGDRQPRHGGDQGKVLTAQLWRLRQSRGLRGPGGRPPPHDAAHTGRAPSAG